MKKIIRRICTFMSKIKLKKYGKNLMVNFPCSFSKKTIVGDNCSFNGMSIKGDGNVCIGNNFHSGRKCLMITSFHNYDYGKKLPYDDTYINKDIIIEDNVWIGYGVTILGGVKIGEGAIVQACSVVVKDVPPLSIVGGHPAVEFKKRNKEHYYALKDKENDL